MEQERKTDVFLSKDDRESLKQYFNEIKNNKPLSIEQEAELVKRIQNGDNEARDILVNANLKFVVTIAKQFQNRGLDLNDLISEGNIGLVRAVDKFDGAHDVKFISYAVWWIRESIIQALAKNGHTIRLPMNQIELIGKINKVIKEFESKNDRTPTENEIADILDVVDREVTVALNASNIRGISIDTSYSEEDDRTFLDTYDVPDDYASDSGLLDEELQSEIRHMLEVLSPFEQYVIGHLLGVGYDKLGINEIAENLHLPKAKIQQTKEKGIRHLREKTKHENLKQLLIKM